MGPVTPIAEGRLEIVATLEPKVGSMWQHGGDGYMPALLCAQIRSALTTRRDRGVCPEDLAKHPATAEEMDTWEEAWRGQTTGFIGQSLQNPNTTQIYS